MVVKSTNKKNFKFLYMLNQQNRNLLVIEVPFSTQRVRLINLFRNLCFSDKSIENIVRRYNIRSILVGYKSCVDDEWKFLENVPFVNVPEGYVQVLLYTNDPVPISILQRVSSSIFLEIEKTKTPV